MTSNPSPSVAAIKPMSRLNRVVCALIAASLLGGCKTLEPLQQLQGNAATPVQQGPITPLKPSADFTQLRSAADMNKLFERGSISGKDALTELRAMKQLSSQQGVQKALGSLYGTQPQSMAGQQTPDLSALGKLDYAAMAEAVGDHLVTEMSMTALENFFTTLTDNPAYFENETVELPKNIQNFTPAQRQRVLVLAASLIAIKGSNKIVEASNKDKDKAEAAFKQVLEKREKAVGVMLAALDAWRKAKEDQREAQARQLDDALSADDLDFLSRFPKDMKVSDFKDDLAVQNIALEYLRKKDPAQFKDYAVSRDEYVSSLNQYMRATVGVASFAGFSYMFLREGRRAFEAEGFNALQTAVPFGDQFLKEFGTFGQKSLVDWGTSLKKGVVGIFSSTGDFRIDRAVGGKPVEEQTDIKGVLAFLEKQQLDGQFHDRMFASGVDGYMFRVNLCENGAGRLLDKAIGDGKVRQDFVKQFYGLDDATGFTFTNALDGTWQPKRRTDLAGRLLRSDQRKAGGDGRAQAIAGIQRQTIESIKKWDDADLAELIYASYGEGSRTQAHLKYGDYIVRMVPSQWTIYQYERYEQKCSVRDMNEQIARMDAQPIPAKVEQKVQEKVKGAAKKEIDKIKQKAATKKPAAPAKDAAKKEAKP
jgi:hypothetical protein